MDNEDEVQSKNEFNSVVSKHLKQRMNGKTKSLQVDFILTRGHSQNLYVLWHSRIILALGKLGGCLEP